MEFRIPASWSEGAGDAKENDLFAGGERVDGNLLHLILLIEVGKSPVGDRVTNSNRSHFSKNDSIER